MSDIALRWDAAALAADLAVEANDLARDEGLETAVLLSLFTDRRAENTDLPFYSRSDPCAAETDRRGWWGDAVPVLEGERIGSRLWLLAREKQTEAVLSSAEEYAREALRWLLEDLVAERVDVVAEFPRAGMLALTITIHRPRSDAVSYRFANVWAAQGA